MREVLGPNKMLMIDNGIAIKWDVTDAVRRARAMEEYDLAWIEEPLGAWDPEGYANLRAKTTTRIAYGEREWTLEQFERVLATGTVDVIGVDPGRAEGITGFKKVTERCEFYRRQANAHAWSSAIVTAASLAISFNSPSCKLFEFKPLRNPMQHDLGDPARSSTSMAGCIRRPGRGSASRSSRRSSTVIAAKRCSRMNCSCPAAPNRATAPAPSTMLRMVRLPRFAGEEGRPLFHARREGGPPEGRWRGPPRTSRRRYEVIAGTLDQSAGAE